MNITHLISGSPLVPLFEDGKLNSSCCPTLHRSDLLRMATLYRYGGWYNDLDIVTINKTNDIVDNIVAANGPFISNAVLMFEKKSEFLGSVMQKAAGAFDGRGWNSMGPPLLTKTLRKCDLANKRRGLLGKHPKCGVTVLTHDLFYPVEARMQEELFKQKVDRKWRNLFKKSLLVHFYGQITSGRYVMITANTCISIMLQVPRCDW